MSDLAKILEKLEDIKEELRELRKAVKETSIPPIVPYYQPPYPSQWLQPNWPATAPPYGGNTWTKVSWS